MPILACVGMSLFIYMLLFYSLKKEKEVINSRELSIASMENYRQECRKCGSSYHRNWCYCPYCGESREKR